MIFFLEFLQTTTATESDEELLTLLYPDKKGEPQPLPPKLKKEKRPYKEKLKEHSLPPVESIIYKKYRNTKVSFTCFM